MRKRPKQEAEEQFHQKINNESVDSGNGLINWLGSQSGGRLLLYLLYAFPGVALWIVFSNGDEIAQWAFTTMSETLAKKEFRVQTVDPVDIESILVEYTLDGKTISVWQYSVSTNPPFVAFFIAGSAPEDGSRLVEALGANVERFNEHANFSCYNRTSCPIYVNGILWGFVQSEDESIPQGVLRQVGYAISTRVNPFQYNEY